MADTFGWGSWGNEVAAALGDGWKVTETEENRYAYPHVNLAGPDGMRISAERGRDVGRISISWDIPHELREHRGYREDTRKEITISEDKTPARAAGDITRRLLPGLTDMTAQLTIRRARHLAQEREQADYLAGLATLLKAPARSSHRTDEVRFSKHTNGGYEYYGTVEYHSGGSTAKLTLELSPENMRLVAEFVAQQFIR